MAEKVKILFLSAEPQGAARLRLGEEVRDIEQKLRSAPAARSFKLISQWAVRARDLTEILMIHQPTVVHFSGHASGGKIILEDEHGSAHPVEGKHIASLLSSFGDSVSMVVLNACYSTAGFGELSSVVDFIVGTTAVLDDRAAIRFSSCFYQSLAFGKSVEKAFAIAKSQITLEGLTDSEVFSLLVRQGVDASEPFLGREASGAKASTSDSVSDPAAPEEAADDADSDPKQNAKVAASPTASDTRSREDQDSGASLPKASNQRDFSIPLAIQESLRRFKRDFPDPSKVAFLMMRFGKTKAHEDIVAGVKAALDPLGISAVRADDKQYHDDLFPNVLTYIYGCSFGIAVFERIESEQFNPNVALEVGYMFAIKKNICFLKDRSLSTLQADLVGKLYRVFDPFDPIGSIPKEVSGWLEDKGLLEKDTQSDAQAGV